ncbi:hypothetical protein D187_008507 [Cystobacter fuscus DSM 2262]|uniref:Uncharacterized protein n=1 Tax=Cystobacter fuscus (strain ATCC 25194 / DSM 2262 / NBRC 100088 / M29) TaxID=1242864 RepID=S9PD56_CYSF2|nr:hypothetical protein D187_008507 [Cystobacter fuscus DSM 2262]
MAVHVAIDWDHPAQRLRCTVLRARRTTGGWPFRSGPAQVSPFLR